MRTSELRIGSSYVAKVSGRLVPVRLERIDDCQPRTRYHVHNQRSGRRLVFRSAQRFHREIV